MYGNIVVGFDNSEFSKAATIESSNWVRRHGGRLTLVHAVYFDEEEFAAAPDQREKRFALGERACLATHKTIASEFGFNGNLESLVCEGDPPDVIVEVARERGADLITLGTHGRKGLQRMLMGSVTSKVILSAPCDVLVVKRPCSECTGTYDSVLVPFDGSEPGRQALRRACELARIDGAEIAVLYAIPRYEEMVDYFRTASIKGSLFHEAEKVMDEARGFVDENGVSITTQIDEGHAEEVILRAAGAMKSDLIVVGTHGWRGVDRMILGSTAERVITNASCPVLVVR